MTPQCYLCHQQTRLLFHKNGYDIVRCPSCLLAMTVLRSNYDDFSKSFYNKGYFTGEKSCAAYRDYEKDKPVIVKNMKHILSKIRPFVPKGKLLDVGCAYGFLVEQAVKEGYDAYGIDVSTHAVQQAPHLVKTRIQQGTIKTLPKNGVLYDAVTMLDIFEHLEDPITELASLAEFIKKDGHLLIGTGDAGSWLPKLIGRRWTFYIPPQHLMFFHKRHIAQMLSQTGFQPVKWFRMGKWVSLGYILHLAQTTGESTIAETLSNVIEKIGVSDIPVYMPIGDNIVVIAKKL